MLRHKNIIANRGHREELEDGHPLVVVPKTTRATQRQIENAARESRCQIKCHEHREHGLVARFLADGDCRLLETHNGWEICFRRNAVLNDCLDAVAFGSAIRTVELASRNCPQAGTMRPSCNHRPV